MTLPFIFQTTNDRFLNLIINHPSVRATAQQGTEWLNSFDVLSDRENICFAGTGGAALFIVDSSGAYTGHIFLVDGARGAAGLAFGKAVLEALFARKPVGAVSARVPVALPAARWYVRRLGFTSLGDSPDGLEELFEIRRQGS